MPIELVVGGAILAGLGIGLWWWGRRRLIQTVVRGANCPNCGRHQWHRVHRRLSDRVFGVGLGVRRYQCANPECLWEGLRRRY